MNLPADSPIWKYADNAAIVGGIAFFSWLNASNFDHTEYLMIAEFGVWLLTYSKGKSTIQSHSKGST